MPRVIRRRRGTPIVETNKGKRVSTIRRSIHPHKMQYYRLDHGHGYWWFRGWSWGDALRRLKWAIKRRYRNDPAGYVPQLSEIYKLVRKGRWERISASEWYSNYHDDEYDCSFGRDVYEG